jgi:hypothetical protein
VRPLVVAFLLAACEPPIDAADDPDDAGGKADWLPGGNEEIPTRNGGARPLDGYNALVDRVEGICVVPRPSDNAEFEISEATDRLDLVLVQSREELARQLGFELGLKVRYGIGNGNGALSMVDELRTTTRSVNLLVKGEVTYMVQNNWPLELAEPEAELLTRASEALWSETPDGSLAAEFLGRCGTQYVEGVRHGAAIYVLVSVEAKNERQAEMLSASLGLGAGRLTMEFDAKASANLSQTLEREGLQATVRIRAEGFYMPGVGSGEGTALEDELLSKIPNPSDASFIDAIQGITRVMRSSVDYDRCIDVGQGEACVRADGKSSAPVGYEQVADRSRAVLGVRVAQYGPALPGFNAAQHQSVIDWIRDSAKRATTHIRVLTALEERATVVYQSELQAFREASDKAEFNLAESPRQGIGQVTREVNRWADEFRPSGSTGVAGLQMELVRQGRSACWESVIRNRFDACTEPPKCIDSPSSIFQSNCPFKPQPGVDVCQWCSMDAMLEEYEKSARVLPLDYEIARETTFDDAPDACAELDTMHTTYRLPTLEEVRLLGPVVADGNVPWGETWHEVWYDPPDSWFAEHPERWPSYRNDPSEPHPEDYDPLDPSKTREAFLAIEPTFFYPPTRTVICVPSGGVLPQVPGV